MTIKDISILIKKILVGVIVYLIPVQIIFGGLWLTHRFLKKAEKKESTSSVNIKASLKN